MNMIIIQLYTYTYTTLCIKKGHKIAFVSSVPARLEAHRANYFTLYVLRLYSLIFPGQMTAIGIDNLFA